MAGGKRSAENSIRGYYYQFDYSIIKVLELRNDDDTICIEGIEDVDTTDDNCVAFHQCKCYEGEKYVPSKIAKAIRQMLWHYANNKTKGYHYHFYGTFKSGQDKFPGLSLEFVKEKICTYTQDGVHHVLYTELSLNDDDLNVFISHLTIDVNAPSYYDQEKIVIETIGNALGCGIQEATLYYCNALYKIKQLAVQTNESDRIISKAEFINAIKTVDAQFEMWLLHKNGVDKFAKAIKKKYFSDYNISPYSRFFIIEVDNKISVTEIKTTMLHIAEKYSKLRKRDTPKFSPFFCFCGINDANLIELKKQLSRDKVVFTDGYNFRGADFDASSIVKKPSNEHPIKLRIVDNVGFLESIYELCESTIEIYQFYRTTTFYENSDHKHIKIPFEKINDIVQMI